MLKKIYSLPKIYRFWILTLTFGFFASGVFFTFSLGNREYSATDETTEQLIIFASKQYELNGFFKNATLPTAPPFGFDDEGKPRTKPFVYTHYFPGPYWVTYFFRLVFGENHFIIYNRILPLALNVVGLLWLSLEFALLTMSPLLGCLLFSGLLTARSITAFSICIAGHGYVMGALLIAIAFLIYKKRTQKNDEIVIGKKSKLFMFIIGFFQIWFSLDFLPLTFFTLLGMMLILDFKNIKNIKNVALYLFLGGTFGFLLQVALFAIHLNSLYQVLENFIKWGTWRMGLHNFGGADQTSDSKLKLIAVLREYNKQAYGATGFTGINLFILSLAFIIMGYLGCIINKEQFKKAILGYLLVYCGAIAWNVLMRQHSMIHIFFIPRHYVVLFIAFLIIALNFSKQLVGRSQSLSALDF